MAAISSMRFTPSAVSISGITRMLAFEWSRWAVQQPTDHLAPSTVGHMPRPPGWYQAAVRARSAVCAVDTFGGIALRAPQFSARVLAVCLLVGMVRIGAKTCMLDPRVW